MLRRMGVRLMVSAPPLIVRWGSWESFHSAGLFYLISWNWWAKMEPRMRESPQATCLQRKRALVRASLCEREWVSVCVCVYLVIWFIFICASSGVFLWVSKCLFFVLLFSFFFTHILPCFRCGLHLAGCLLGNGVAFLLLSFSTFSLSRSLSSHPCMCVHVL